MFDEAEFGVDDISEEEYNRVKEKNMPKKKKKKAKKKKAQKQIIRYTLKIKFEKSIIIAGEKKKKLSLS